MKFKKGTERDSYWRLSYAICVLSTLDDCISRMLIPIILEKLGLNPESLRDRNAREREYVQVKVILARKGGVILTETT